MRYSWHRKDIPRMAVSDKNVIYIDSIIQNVVRLRILQIFPVTLYRKLVYTVSHKTSNFNHTYWWISGRKVIKSEIE